MCKEMKRDSIVFYASFWEVMQKMSRADRLAFVEAVCSYAFDDKETSLNGAAELAFILAKPQIDANIQRYENGKKGGRPKKTDGFENEKPMVSKKENHTSAEKKPNVNVNVNVNDNVYISKEDRQKILVKFFFKNLVNPQEELTRYLEWGDSTGWKKSNGQAITDKVAYASFWKPESKGERFPLPALRLLQAAYAYAQESSDEKAAEIVTSIVSAKDDFGKLNLIWPSRTAVELVIPYIQKANRNTLKMDVDNQYMP